MASADKCFLQIPFKDYLKSLKVDGEGKIPQQALSIAASREFENYKAIERRINDSGCGAVGCTCSWVKAISSAVTISLAGGTLATGTAVWSAILYEQGGWTISGGNLIPPDSTILHQVNIVSFFQHLSGASGVNTMLNANDSIRNERSMSYAPADFDSRPPLSRLAPMDATFFVGGSLISPVAATRSMQFTAELNAWASCCPAPVI